MIQLWRLKGLHPQYNAKSPRWTAWRLGNPYLGPLKPKGQSAPHQTNRRTHWIDSTPPGSKGLFCVHTTFRSTSMQPKAFNNLWLPIEISVVLVEPAWSLILFADISNIISRRHLVTCSYTAAIHLRWPSPRRLVRVQFLPCLPAERPIKRSFASVVVFPYWILSYLGIIMIFKLFTSFIHKKVR